MGTNWTTIDTRITAADTALAAGNYDTARLELARTTVLLIAIPDANKGDEGYRQRSNAIKDAREAIDDAEQSASSVVGGKKIARLRVGF